MTRLILLNKPCGTLCQFSDDGSGKVTLSGHISIADIYPAGRLDTDSEGLLALTNNGVLQARLSQPRNKLAKTYWAQVEGELDDVALERLRAGVELKDGMTLPALAQIIKEPSLWPRVPEIRQRKNSPTVWLELQIKEGRNRQVRRMTAAVGYPTLRLVRAAIGPLQLGALLPGQWREVPIAEIEAAFGTLPKVEDTGRQGRQRRAGRGEGGQRRSAALRSKPGRRRPG